MKHESFFDFTLSDREVEVNDGCFISRDISLVQRASGGSVGIRTIDLGRRLRGQALPSVVWRAGNGTVLSVYHSSGVKNVEVLIATHVWIEFLLCPICDV